MTTLADRLRAALLDRNVQAFLRVIRAGESSQDDGAYSTLVGGTHFAGLADHPRVLVRLSASLASTAAGAYQFLARTWDEARAALDLPDFGPASQDLAAVYLIDRRHALADVQAGRLDEALAKCSREWASLPGSPYGQPTMTAAQARQVYAQFGGGDAPTRQIEAGAAAIAAAPIPTPPRAPPQPPEPAIPAGEAQDWPPPPKAQIMAPIIAAVLPAIVQAIPSLTRIFGHGGEVSERNARAAEAVVGIVQQATGTVNAQQAAEAVAGDSDLRAKAQQAVAAQWWQITEAGGGGIDGARKADAAAAEAGHKPWQSASMWALLALLPMAYLVIGSVVGLWGTSDWSPDVRASIASAVVSLIIGGAAGYYWGASTQRNRPQ